MTKQKTRFVPDKRNESWHSVIADNKSIVVYLVIYLVQPHWQII